ncbi:hypothetical protein LUZ60_011654 [Juncus effusus]|nr:hypothetical protein LUZ60_011654 [Juncus effusus]
MGSSEVGNQSKNPPKATQPQGTSASTTPATPVYPDWSSFQAYSPVPYMWGAQPMMPPYGTPPPYMMYPPGGIYPHPSMPPGASPYSPFPPPANGNTNGHGAATAPGGSEADGKNNNELAKASGGSGNGGVSHSGESGSESSSEGSDANSDTDSQPKANNARQDSTEGAPAGTNLKIGLEYYAAASFPGPSKLATTPSSATLVPIQDERELKRQRRKQSNRESARRSRLRKQAECEELAQRADALREENATLRDEVEKVKKKHKELLAQNKSLKEKLGNNNNNNNESSDNSEHEA